MKNYRPKMTVLTFILWINVVVAQQIEIKSFARFGGSGSDHITAMITDSQGNLYITGCLDYL